MNQCPKCESFDLKWHNDLGECSKCGTIYTKEEYLLKKKQKAENLANVKSYFFDVNKYIGLSSRIEKLQNELKFLTEQYETIENAIEEGRLKSGRILQIEGDLKSVVNSLLTNYKPPEIFTAAYKIRSALENWLKYELLFDTNTPFYPTTWDTRKPVFFKSKSNEFAKSFISIYRNMNIFVHQNLEDLVKNTLVTDEQKINAIRIGLDFIEENQLYVKDELASREKLLLKHETMILNKLDKFFEKYPSCKFDNIQACSKFNNELDQIKRVCANQTALCDYLSTKNYKISQPISTTDKHLKKMFKSKYNTEEMKGIITP